VIKSRRVRWVGHVARTVELRNWYKILVGKPEGKRPLGRPRRRWEDNTGLNLREMGWGKCELDASGSGQGPVAGYCEQDNEPSGSIKGGEFFE
jgi:hypothetical protein